MAEEGLQTVQIKTDFYRDSFGKVIFIIASIFLAIIFLIAVALYLHYEQPPPIVFNVDKEWRVKPEVPLDQPYLPTAEVLQWVGEIIPRVFTLDYYHYNDQLKSFQNYFTENGWKIYQNQLNIYANSNDTQQKKLFLMAAPSGAPYIVKEGLLTGRYGWWVQMPITIQYIGGQRTLSNEITLQILVLRVSTLNNLAGVAIDNIIVTDKEGA